MNGNAELLNFIYQNSQMGVDTIKQLLGIAEDDNFINHLESQYNEYKEIHTSAKLLLNKNGYGEKEVSAFDQIRTYLMINLQTITDKTPSHISEMLIIGSNMGVIDAIKNLKRYHDAECEIVNLMGKLKIFEENNIQRLKNYL